MPIVNVMAKRLLRLSQVAKVVQHNLDDGTVRTISKVSRGQSGMIDVTYEQGPPSSYKEDEFVEGIQAS